MPQAAKVHVSSAHNDRETLPRHTRAGRILARPGNPQSPGRLQHSACFVEAILDRGADLIGRDGYHFIDMLLADTERLLPHRPHRRTVRKQADLQIMVRTSRPIILLGIVVKGEAEGGREQ